MNKIYKIVGFVFLGILSLGINTVEGYFDQSPITIANIFDDIKICKKSVLALEFEKLKKTEKCPNLGCDAPDDPQVLGVAKIKLKKTYHDEEICSGSLLKPWIVLTTSSCVSGATPKSLLVEITYSLNGHISKATVGVSEIFTNPKRNLEISGFNQSILIIYAQEFWHVNEFVLMNHFHPPRKIIKEHFKTFQNKWIPPRYDSHKKIYRVTTVNTNLTLHYGKCDFHYCVIMKDSNEPFNKMDIGTPYFFEEPKGVKTLLGIYEGDNIDSPTKGRIFKTYWPGCKWILEVINSRTVPPVEPQCRLPDF